VFKDAASDAALREAFFSGAAPILRMVVPDFGTIEGAFQITALKYNDATDEAEQSFSASFEALGPLRFY
jgi:TP901-1 family phage major tail protein